MLSEENSQISYDCKHELASREKDNFIDQAGRSNFHASVVNSIVNTGRGRAKSYFYLANEAGGENIGVS